MIRPELFNLLALATLVPAALAPLRKRPARDAMFWTALALAVVGPVLWSAVLLADHWRTGLSQALWVSIAAAMVLYAALCLLMEQAWRLAPLLLPYLLLLGSIAAVWHNVPADTLAPGPYSAWLEVHIGMAVLTYALLTVAAVAAFGAFLQERALKLKRPDRLTRMLPPVADGERISSRLLAVAEVVLGAGLLSGMAMTHMQTGSLFPLDHKAVLSFLAFLVIGALLLAQHLSGMRGRAAARVVLFAYLLLTLAYPGVKFVTQVLMA